MQVIVRTKLILMMCSGSGDSNDDGRVDDIGGVDTNGSDDANCDDGVSTNIS